MAKEMVVGKGSKMIEDGAAIVKATHADDMLDILRGSGVAVELVGGTLPKLEFSTPGEARLVRYESRKEGVKTEDSENAFNVLTFAELDAKSFAECVKAGDKAGENAKVVGRGFLTEGVALGDYFETRATIGDVLVIVYGGSEERGKNRTMNLYTIHRVYAAPRA